MSRDWHYCSPRRETFQEKQTEYSEKFIISDINFYPSADAPMMGRGAKKPHQGFISPAGHQVCLCCGAPPKRQDEMIPAS
jgi:hypothetical protein